MIWIRFRKSLRLFLAFFLPKKINPLLRLPENSIPKELESPDLIATALSEELSSGRIPPYSVQGTYLYLRFPKEDAAFAVAKYQELFDVYHAKIAKFTAHEMEVFFKSNPSSDHRLLAFSFYRDLLRSYGKESKLVMGYLTSGWIEFGEVQDKPEFFGEVLNSLREFVESTLQSNESLGFIHNSLVECYSAYGQFADSPGGFSRIQKLTQISDVLETYMPLEGASYFRHPEDLAQTLSYLSEKIVEGELVELKDAFFKLKSFRLGEKNIHLLNSYKSLLNLLIRLYRQNLGMKHLISSCIAVAPYLLAPDTLDDELKELLSWCLQFKDPRIKANTLEALGHFDPDNPQVSHFLSSKFNRVASEALIIHARKELDDDLTKQILSFLSSSNPFFVASGLYLVGFICEYHFQQDYSYFTSNPNFKVLIDKSEVFKNHPHSMIRQRARATLKILEGLKGAA